MNTKLFFDSIRKSLFGGKLSQSQVDVINLILEECERVAVSDKRKVAYILATAYHEVGRDLQPVREGFKKTDKEAISHVTRLFNKGKISENYALPKENGKSYFGRGLVQLTWDYNYIKAGTKLNMDLYSNPDIVLELPVSVKILVVGMSQGWFTTKKLSDYFNADICEWEEARRIVNRKDKAALIAEYAIKFYEALRK